MPQTRTIAFPYREAFLAIEKALLDYGSHRRSRSDIQRALDEFKRCGQRELTDERCFSILVDVVFYSGMRAATVMDRHSVIHRHLADFRRVAEYNGKDIERIMSDPSMLRNRRKIGACVANAQVMGSITQQCGSFSSYIASFRPGESFENLLLLKEELQARFEYLGGITVYHFLTELGMPVLKPDRVIARLFRRLGLVEYENQHLKTVLQGRKFMEATGLPIRYIDIVLVAYGQVQSQDFGVDRGICLSTPRCHLCGVTHLCPEYRSTGATA